MASVRERIQAQAVTQLAAINPANGYTTTVLLATRLDFNIFDPVRMPVCYVSMPVDRHNVDISGYQYEGRVALLRVEYAWRTQNQGQQLVELENGIEDVCKAMLARNAQGQPLNGEAISVELADIDLFSADTEGVIVGAVIDFEVQYRWQDPPPNPSVP
jgi:hypothetical protein